MADPPLEAGAVQDTTDWALAFDVAVTPVGAPGVVAGMAAADAAEAGLCRRVGRRDGERVAGAIGEAGHRAAGGSVVQVKLPGDEVTV